MRTKDAFLGRVLLGWSRERLAQESGVPVSEVYTFERIGQADPEAVAKIKAALEAGGIEFVLSDEVQPGVQLRKIKP